MAKKKDGSPKRVKVHIAPDLADRLTENGGDLDERVEAILRGHLGDDTKPQGKLAGFIADIAGPLKDHPLVPHIEKAAKDVATKVARDVATAAAAAALAAWTSKTTARDEPPAERPGPKTSKPRATQPPPKDREP